MDRLLDVDALTRRYDDRLALASVDFSLMRGEVLGLLGPNGAGKTTCLQLLSGNLAPTSGRIRVLGIDLAEAPVRAKRHIGYLPERPPLYTEMRLDEYLRFCARLRRVPTERIDDALESVKERCGLEGMGRRILGRLSKGFRQRVGIAQALIHDPDVIILDEPTDGLDPVQIREVRALVRELAVARGLILSSHILSEVQAVCDRVLILGDGRLLHEARLDRGHTDRFVVRLLDPPPDASPLAALPNVEGAERLEPDRFRIELAARTPPDRLAASLVEAGFRLAELTPERTDIERTFFGIFNLESPP